jgi:hypothetical protein
MARDQSELVAPRHGADADLKRDQPRVGYEPAQQLERVRLCRDGEFYSQPARDLIEQLAAADTALGERDRIGGAIAQPQGTLLASG